MGNAVQYITDEQGERVGVVLDMREYQRLTHRRVIDSDLLMLRSASSAEKFDSCSEHPQMRLCPVRAASEDAHYTR